MQEEKLYLFMPLKCKRANRSFEVTQDQASFIGLAFWWTSMSVIAGMLLRMFDKEEK